MNKQNLYLSCIVNKNNKYIGGRTVINGQVHEQDTVEKLYVGDIVNINNYHWIKLNDKLSSLKSLTRSVIYKDLIY